jgi:hypothetical protein
MKTIIVCLFVSLLCTGLYAQAEMPGKISSNQASIAASQHLVKFGLQNNYTLNEAFEIRNEDMTLAYVLELEPIGYIVVGASEGLPPMIAYSFESHFGSLDGENPLYKLLKADLIKRTALFNFTGHPALLNCKNKWEALLSGDPASPAAPLFEQWPATGDGWLKTNWTQSPPYNNFCPMDPVTDVRSVAGCPATAMAQIMNFHETTNNTYFDDADDYYHNYAGRQYWIDDDHETVDFPSFPEINAYLDTLNAHYSAGAFLSAADKAALTFACGIAARQVFTSEGSGTFGVNQAYEAYLRFGCNTVALLDSNDTGLFDRLKQNIIDTLPAHLAVVDEAWSYGHNVVVDGYNTDEYYHLNFGWGGSFNGWYLLPEEIPYALSVIEGVVVDIMKKLPAGIITAETSSLNTSVFPNPVRDNAMIEFSLTESSTVFITLCDPSGRLVLACRSDRQLPGRHTIRLSLGNLPSGIYFYSIQSDRDFSSGKILKLE